MNRQKTGGRSKPKGYTPARDDVPVKKRAGARPADYDDFDDFDAELYEAKRPARSAAAPRGSAAPRGAAKPSRPVKRSKATLPFGDDGYGEARAPRPVREPYDNRPIRKDRYEEARPARRGREIDEHYPVRSARGYDEELPAKRRARAQSPRPAYERPRRGEYDDFDEPVRKKSAPRRKKKESSAIIWWLIAIVGALIIGFGLRTFGFELLTVNGDAMDGTLAPGQITLVEKAVYYGSKPARGDIVGVKAPEGMIIRRVVALPGESIEIKNGVTYVNGEALEEKYVLKKGGGDYPLTTIPDGAYFVMSDNRLNTDDSRTFGLIRNTRSLIVGRVGYILWPMTDWGKITR